MNIALVIEGIMKSPVSEAPIPTGIALYKALVDVEHRLFLLTENRDALLLDWLKFMYLPGYIGLEEIDQVDQISGTLHRSLNKLRVTGPVDLVIDPDPARCADTFEHGYTVMPMLIPAFARPHWRPDYNATPRPWQQLEIEVQRQRELAVQAARREEQE